MRISRDVQDSRGDNYITTILEVILRKTQRYFAQYICFGCLVEGFKNTCIGILLDEHSLRMGRVDVQDARSDNYITTVLEVKLKTQRYFAQ